MADFTVLNLQYNTGSDSTPTWTGTALAFSGTSGANEIRFGTTTGQTAIASASWPFYTRPAVVTAVANAYAYTADAVGATIATYTGTNANSNVLRWNWDNSGTFASAPQFSWFDVTSAHPNPTAGSGTIGGGNATDTGGSGTSYVKINAWGTYQTTNLAAAAAGTTLSATVGTAGAVTPGAGAWLATWQDAAGFRDYILGQGVPAATTANDLFWSMVLYTGPNMTTGTFGSASTAGPSFTFQYSFA